MIDIHRYAVTVWHFGVLAEFTLIHILVMPVETPCNTVKRNGQKQSRETLNKIVEDKPYLPLGSLELLPLLKDPVLGLELAECGSLSSKGFRNVKPLGPHSTQGDNRRSPETPTG